MFEGTDGNIPGSDIRVVRIARLPNATPMNNPNTAHNNGTLTFMVIVGGR